MYIRNCSLPYHCEERNELRDLICAIGKSDLICLAANTTVCECTKMLYNYFERCLEVKWQEASCIDMVQPNKKKYLKLFAVSKSGSDW